MPASHSQDVKARCMAALLAGQSTAHVAEEHGVPPRTVSTWATELGGMEALRSGALHNLLFTYTEENLTTLAAQAVHMRDKDWLMKQDAQQLGVCHGILSDKAIRILAAMERAAPSHAEPDAHQS